MIVRLYSFVRRGVGLVILLHAFAVVSHAENDFDVVKAIEAINPNSPTRLDFRVPSGLPEGGHLQGVQWINQDSQEALLLSGSSNTLAYLLRIPIGESNALTATLIKLHDEPLRHAGGFQILGNRFLAVGLEDNHIKDTSEVWLMSGQHLSQTPMIRIKRQGPVKRSTAGAVALADDLLMVATWDSSTIDFYHRNDVSLGAPGCEFKLRETWVAAEADRADWKDAEYGSYQNINIVTSSGKRHYLAGMCLSGDQNRLDLFELRLGKEVPLPRRLRKVASKIFHCQETTFLAGAGLRKREDGRLQLYACAHRKPVIEVFD